jgi:hypothetical protein
MITLARFKEIGELFVRNSPTLKKFVHGVADEDIMAKLKKVKKSEYPVLVGLVPSLVGKGKNLDQLRHDLPMMFYCLDSLGNYTESELDLRWDELLSGINDIELALKLYESDPQWEELIGFNPETINIDPEYGPWDTFGWSISFDVIG